MSHIPCRYLLAGAILLASPAFALAQTSGAGAGAGSSGAPAMTSPGPADPGAAAPTAPGASIGDQVPIHGTFDMSTPSLSGSLDKSPGTACGGSTSTSGAGDMGASLDSSANANCGIGFGTDDLKSLSILDSGASSSGAIDVSKP